jgi:hypothetical protein
MNWTMTSITRTLVSMDRISMISSKFRPFGG